ncbi:hypothetical protein PG991_001641 [Apiospora marii]|uniref:Cytochrome P450 n=1 Tax=Apiospora marii TaxID=335849 RepID=A0ABR1SQ97_9PEZI
MSTEKLGPMSDLGRAAWDYVSASRYPRLIGMVLLWFWALFFQPKRPGIANAPVHGSRGFWEPDFFLKTRFIYDAYRIIGSGFDRVIRYLLDSISGLGLNPERLLADADFAIQYKDRPFILRRHDADINVLPMKYLDELRLVPREELNGKMNIFRSWPWASVISDSDLHVTVLTRKLNPDLPRYVELAREELDYGWDKDVPQPDDWAVVDIQGVMRQLVARMSAKVFLGEPVCRDPTWLDLTINFSVDIFMASFALRAFPWWCHFLVKPLIPARRRVHKQIRIGTEVVRSLMAERDADADEVVTGDGRGSGKGGTLFDWMMENAVGKEGSLGEMAARQCILTLASIHTTATTVANALFDLIAHPEWIDVLREEIRETTENYGDLGQNDSTKAWLNRLEKMDSFIVESQRVHPPILLTPQRIAMVPITLKDGTHIPVGTRVAWAGPQHSLHPSITPHPATFDPLRNYRKRHASEENRKRFMAGQTDPDNMSFGYGNQICPGRYFAVFEIKMMLMRLLEAFDFAAPPGKGKGWPRTIYADENVILDPYAKVMMRKRQGVTG